MRLLLLAALTLSACEPAPETLSETDSSGDVISTTATGRVISISPSDNFISLDHDPIPAIGMGAMRMPFDVAPDLDYADYKPGEAVLIALRYSDAEGLLITDMCRPAQDGADCLR